MIKCFIQLRGVELTDKEFIIEYFESLFNEEIMDSLYTTVIDFGEVGEIDIEKVVAFLAGYFYVFNYSSEPTVVSYLKSSSLEDIVRLFKENYDFGIAMVKSYFEAICDEDRYKDNRNMIFDRNDQGKLLEFEQKNEILKIMTINNILRGIICNIYNHYIDNDCSDYEALDKTWGFFFEDLDPLEEFSLLGKDDASRKFYKAYLLGLIYGDLYEDVCNESIIKSDNAEDQLADMTPILSVQLGTIGIPVEGEIRNRLLKHFILLQDERKKMDDNRKKTYSDDRIKELKKINPFYMLDEMSFN